MVAQSECTLPKKHTTWLSEIAEITELKYPPAKHTHTHMHTSQGIESSEREAEHL